MREGYSPEMRRLLVLFAVSAGAFVTAPGVLADTPLFATTDGTGVVHGTTQYVLMHVPVPVGSVLSATSTTSGAELRQYGLSGYWYFPNTPVGVRGISTDGKTILLINLRSKKHAADTTFIAVDPLGMKQIRTFKPYAEIRPRPDYLLTDALSPDASRLYAVAYTDSNTGLAEPCGAEYGYDVRAQRLLSIKTDVHPMGMDGTAMSRATSADGRWDYTLYREASGASFIQVLDTAGAAVHCVPIPASNGTDLGGISLESDNRTLVVSSGGGSPKLDVAVGSWAISVVPAGFPWFWLAVGGGLALLAAGGLVLWRRRGEKVANLAS